MKFQYHNESDGAIMRWSFLLLMLFIISSTSRLVAADATDASRLHKVLAAKVVRVCIWPEYYNISYRNPKTLQLSGLDIDMANALGKDLGVSVQFIDSSFAKLVDDITENHCDIAMFAVGITPTREKNLRFSQPYLASDIYAITTKSNRRIMQWEDIDKPGNVVAISKGTLHESVMKEKLLAAELLILNSPFARENEVQSGRADLFMTDYPYSHGFLKHSDWARVIMPPTTYHITPFAYAMPRGDDIWHQRIEEFLGAVKKDGRLSKSAKRYSLETIVIK